MGDVMSEPLGLSIGTTNMVAARVGNPPVTRRSVLPVAGQVVSGFVERVGDPVPLVTDDGTSYRADLLVVRALDELITEAGGDRSSPIAVAVPAHWNGATLRALRDAMRSTPSLAPNGTPVRLVSDAVASLTAMGANPGLPVRGVVALLDFGGGGTSITVADAAASYEPIETTRLNEFSGDQIDQALLAHVLQATAGDTDPGGTASVESLARLRDECRRIKEELSDSSVADVQVDLRGHRSTVQVTRDELEAMVEAPLALVLSELRESLLRNRINEADVSAVVAVGGGARIPLVTRALSENGRSAVVTTPHPALDAAVGAALFAAYGVDADLQTGVAPTALVTEAVVGGDAAPGSSTFRALAWSQDDDTVGEPEPYLGEDPYADPYADFSTTRVVAQRHTRGEGAARSSWHRLPLLIFGVVATIAVIAVGGAAIALTSATDKTKPTPVTAPVTATSPPLPPPTSAVAPPPVTQPPPQNVVTENSAAPPTQPPPTQPPPQTVTVRAPTTTITITSTQPTTTAPTTTTPTTTTPTTTTTTPTTTTTTTTSSTPTMTTSYLTVPFVPIPIPIQVPATATPAPYQPAPYQPPQYQQQPQFPY